MGWSTKTMNLGNEYSDLSRQNGDPNNKHEKFNQQLAKCIKGFTMGMSWVLQYKYRGQIMGMGPLG